MKINRLPVKLTADPSKVILSFFDLPKGRFQLLIDQFLRLSDAEMEQLWETTKRNFAHRHRGYEDRLLMHLGKLEKKLGRKFDLSETGKLLLGAYVTNEYSLEAAALFNPSMVAHPDQSGLPEGAKRFVMSLRAVGEGHISSLSFRQGVIYEDNRIVFEGETPQRTTAVMNDRTYSHQELYRYAGLEIPSVLPDPLSKEDVQNLPESQFKDKLLGWLNENYSVVFGNEIPVSERVIFPMAPSETNGMEDVRLIEMEEEGMPRYLGTYTAYNGRVIQSKVLETDDFTNFNIRSLSGAVIQDKGMAFFPRKVNGKYALLSRQGGESLSIMYSDNYLHWTEKVPLQSPAYPWEFVQIGNCGSPIETPEGWLMLTHAVGPMRRYTLGASLLDLDNPHRVISTLKNPLMEPLEEEREGYVPNVLYTCGWMKHGDRILIPYAMSDSACGFATIEVDELLRELEV